MIKIKLVGLDACTWYQCFWLELADNLEAVLKHEKCTEPEL
jgi:hypothetical protein